MRDQVGKRRRQRGAFLRQLYDVTGGSVSEFVDAHDIGAGLEIEGAELRRHLEYFAEKGWIVVDDFRAGIIRITASGVDRAEDIVVAASDE